MSPEITFCLEKLQFQRLLFCLIISLVNYPEQLLRAFYFSHQSSFSFPNAWKIILHSTPKQNNGSEHPQNPLPPPSLKTNMHIHPYFLPVCQERNVFERPVPLTVFLILTLSTQRTLFHQLSPSSSVSYSLSLLAPSTPQCPCCSRISNDGKGSVSILFFFLLILLQRIKQLKKEVLLLLHLIFHSYYSPILLLTKINIL